MISLAIEESTRSQSEARLRDSEEKFRALFEASSQGVILHDEEKMLEVNPACLRILGFQRPEEIVGKHPADTSAPIQAGGVPAQVLARHYIQECITRGHARFDWVARNSRGEEIPIEIILTRIQWGGRQLIQAVFNDIAERKRAETVLRESEARLRESEARFSIAFHASPILITISRLSDASFIEANNAFIQWIGLERSQIVGRTSRDLQMWLDETERTKFLDTLHEKRSVRDVECRLRSQRGTFHTMLLSADIIEVNREPHMLVFGLDITQRQQAEVELLKTLAREKELGQLRSKFVSMVSHEFRTPLGIIQSSAEILDDYLDQLDLAERKEHLRSIQKNTHRMAGLMEEVLLIGSIEAGKMDFKPAPMDPAAFLRRLVDEVLSATDRRCPIELCLVGAVPAQMEGDERLLRHIFTNLLTNAVKYSEPGRPVQFEVGCDRTDIIASVRDQGIGIPESEQEWLFSAFHRASNVGDRPGSGLGLVIVKRCVDLHGGKIKVESKPGHGTTVTVRLPKLLREAPSCYGCDNPLKP
jgi:PAS domain S-box-containing protein